METFLFTSESVNEGHPDKICDQVSDAILDACLEQDPQSKVACETCTKTNMVMVFGEITTKATVNYEKIVRDTCRGIGFVSDDVGLDADKCNVLVNIEQQSPDIAQGVHGHLSKKPEEIGAGDQGHMFGYATDETPELMPLTHVLATKIGAKLTEVRKNKTCPWVRPDGKTQVTVEYKNDNGAMVPIRVHTILISTQHDEGVTNEKIAADLKEHVIKPVVPAEYLSKIALVAVVLLASLAVFASFVAFAYYCYIRNEVAKRRRNGHKVEDATNLNEKSDFSNLQVVAEEGLKVFTFKQLHSATGGFSKSNVVGHGGFGLVYRGVLNDGRKVGIKFMDQAGKQGEEEFKVEVELLSRLHSPYLLALLGYCSDHNHKLLVYEFMANGGLQEHLYPVSNNNSSVTSVNLDWETRLRIALEAAKGLEYLHEHVSPPVIHRDFKSSNILLDKKFHAKVSDFGLAKLGPDRVGGHVSTRVLGTQGYVAPEYALTGHLTTKSDVYSYGVVLLELLTGRVPVDMKRPPGEGVLVTWALPLLTDREKVVKIMDPALEGQYSMKDVIQVAAIATMCVQPEADYRPLMADVVQSLVPLVKTHRSNSKVGSCSSFNSPKLSPGPAQYSVNANM